MTDYRINSWHETLELFKERWQPPFVGTKRKPIKKLYSHQAVCRHLSDCIYDCICLKKVRQGGHEAHYNFERNNIYYNNNLPLKFIATCII